MTSTTNTGNNTGTSSADTLDCDSAASVLGGMAVPNPAGVCDIADTAPRSSGAGYFYRSKPQQATNYESTL